MENNYEELLALRIAKLCINNGVSEHKVSLDLGKSGSYIRNITCGKSLPSFRELLNIIDYFSLTPAEFFSVFTGKKDDKLIMATEKLWSMRDDKCKGVCQLIEWMN